MHLISEKMLQDLQGALSAEVLADLLAKLAFNLLAETDEIKWRASAQDWVEVAMSAHRLAGTVASFGCIPLGDALGAIDRGLRVTPAVVPSASQIERVVRLANETTFAIEERVARLRSQRGGGGC